MKVRDVIGMIEKDGWYLVGTRGSHRQYHHSVKTGKVTISGRLGAEMKKGTVASVRRQAGLKR